MDTNVHVDMNTQSQDLSQEKSQDKLQEKSQEKSVLTPWEVKGKIDYMAQINHFGTTALDGNLIKKWEKITKMKAPSFIRRGLVFSHQDLDKILDCVEKGLPVYLYTGRGPSGENMHLGHMVPFRLTRYLQQALNCIVIIQMSDDEKFLFKDGSKPEDLERYRKYSYMNAKDIIACGFDLNKTLIFSNLEKNSGSLYFNNVLIMKSNNMGTIKGTFGLGEVLPQSVIELINNALEKEELCKTTDIDTNTNTSKIDEYKSTLKKFSGESSSNIGQCVWPVFQSGPAFCTSFKEVFNRALIHALKTKDLPSYVKDNYKKTLKELSSNKNQQSIMCLVPMAIDQAPYFRMARDDAHILGCPKPAVIHSVFLPGLQQTHGKMNTTGDSANSTLFLNMDPKVVKKTIARHAFSGGKDTLEDHRKYGGDISVDIAYQYLTFFMDDDTELENIARKYTTGEMTSGEIKEIAGDIVANVIAEHQLRHKQVTDDVLKEYFNWDRNLDIGGCFDRPELDTTDDDANYDTYGINFDRTFGYKPKF